jgi:hypothetical protein
VIEEDEGTHAENDTAFRDLVTALAATVHCELHTPHAILVFQLRAYLRCDRVGPWRRRQIEVGAEGTRELFGRDERLV